MISLSRPMRVVAPLAVAVVAYPFLPSGDVRDLGYLAVALVAVLAALWPIARQPTGRPRGWVLLLGGYLAWIVGDAILLLGDNGVRSGPADVVHLASYAVLAGGLLTMVRRRGAPGDPTSVRDVALLAAGLAAVVGVFIVAPVARDSDLSLATQVTSSALPLAAVLVLSILVRLLLRLGGRTTAFRLLGGSVVLLVLAEALHAYRTVIDSSIGSPVAEGVLRLAGFVLAAGAAWTWSAQTSDQTWAQQEAEHDEIIDPRRRLLVVTVGVLLPGAALLLDALTTKHLVGTATSCAVLAMSLLVVSRMRGMLAANDLQATQLAGLARSDALTGIPNQRSWGFELARAAKAAQEANAPLTVALIDLDHLRQYNEAHGRPAGDQLIREAASAWWDLLEPGQLLARYGGGRFALLCPMLWGTDARPMIDAMRARLPGGTTASVGIATWDPQTEPGSVITAAEQALREAKLAGRDQVHLAPRPTSTSLIPRPTMFWQPIVDLTTTQPVGVEALSRFPGDDPLSVFDAATRVGSGPTLEAIAITYALSNRPEGLWVAVNVSLEALASIQVQRALAGNLSGVVLEITERSDAEVPDLHALLQGYRDRGATVAVDDWGRGFSNIDRLAMLQPDIVKLDIRKMTTLVSDHQKATISLITEWAELVGAKVCAEGVETEEQWRELSLLGVHLGQGHFFGRPMPPEELLALPRDTVLARHSA